MAGFCLVLFYRYKHLHKMDRDILGLALLIIFTNTGDRSFLQSFVFQTQKILFLLHNFPSKNARWNSEFQEVPAKSPIWKQHHLTHHSGQKLSTIPVSPGNLFFFFFAFYDVRGKRKGIRHACGSNALGT